MAPVTGAGYHDFQLKKTPHFSKRRICALDKPPYFQADFVMVPRTATYMLKQDLDPPWPGVSPANSRLRHLSTNPLSFFFFSFP